MGKCRRCNHCANCDIVQFYSFDTLRVFIIRTYVKLILWKERELSFLHQLRSLLAFYPERRRLVFYVMHYKIIMWLSIDEVGNHAV